MLVQYLLSRNVKEGGKGEKKIEKERHQSNISLYFESKKTCNGEKKITFTMLSIQEGNR